MRPPPGGRVGGGTGSLRSPGIAALKSVDSVPLRSKHCRQTTPDLPGEADPSVDRAIPSFVLDHSVDRDCFNSIFPRSSSNNDAVFSLKLERRLRKEKSIRGGGTKLRFHPRFARSESCSVVGIADTSSVTHSTVASLRRLASLTLSAALRGPHVGAGAPCPPTPHRGPCRVLPPMPHLRFAATRTSSADHALHGRVARARQCRVMRHREPATRSEPTLRDRYAEGALRVNDRRSAVPTRGLVRCPSQACCL